MYKTISYLEISCKYNKVDLVLFSGALADPKASRLVVYRNRKYFLSYDKDDDRFYLFNVRGILIASIGAMVFKFRVSRAPEIGLEFIWGLLAKLNIYPVKCS